jgi:AraC-like DNA-binding protein
MAKETALDHHRAARFLAVAGELAQSASLDEARLAEFVRLYRTLVVSGRGMRNAAVDADRTRMLVHGMVGASTLGEALQIFVEFIPSLFDDTRAQLRDEGADMALVFHERDWPGADGLICALWPLIVAATELEFLAGAELDGLVGRVKNAAGLPRAVVQLLFPRPLAFQAGETALAVPKVHLARAVAARASDVSGFVADLFRATIRARRTPRDLPSSTADLIRFHVLRGGAGEAANLPSIAGQLGCSVAALRRRLCARGASFREIKAAVLDDLAKTWLRQTELTLEEIAERLGYSDGYSFRRAFRRRNGQSPLSFRQGRRFARQA